MAQTMNAEGTRARGGAMLLELLRATRPKQWVKNVFVFAAIAFSEGRLWTHPSEVLIVFAAFAVFCMAAGSIYLINDLVDIEKDRAHPKKRNRPLASGRLSPTAAITAAVVLLLIALPAAYLLNPGFLVIIVAYMLIQGVIYSYWLKHIVIIDIFTLATGFVLRAVAGAVVLDINITPWLLICMGLLALFLGLGKRRGELALLEEGAGSHRRILDEYSIPMLDQMISIVTAATIIAYTLFTYSATTMPTKPYPVMMITVPFVVYAIFRYLYLIHQHGGGGSPEELVLRDRPLALSIGLWSITVLALLFIFWHR